MKKQKKCQKVKPFDIQNFIEEVVTSQKTNNKRYRDYVKKEIDRIEHEKILSSDYYNAW